MGLVNPPLPPAKALRLFVDARRVTVSVDSGRARFAHDAAAVITFRTGIDPNAEAGADITVHSGCRPRPLRRQAAGGDNDPVRLL